MTAPTTVIVTMPGRPAMTGTLIGDAPGNPACARVRIAGVLWRVPREHISPAPQLSGQPDDSPR